MNYQTSPTRVYTSKFKDHHSTSEETISFSPSKQFYKAEERLSSRTKILCGRSHAELGESVALKIGIPLTKVKVVDFGNTEIGVEISESVRGFHVFIIQTGGPHEGTFLSSF